LAIGFDVFRMIQSLHPIDDRQSAPDPIPTKRLLVSNGVAHRVDDGRIYVCLQIFVVRAKPGRKPYAIISKI